MAGPAKLFLASGCLAGLAAILGVTGVAIVIAAMSHGEAKGEPNGAAAVSDGIYECTVDGTTVIRRFRVQGTSYEDLSFQQGGGSFAFDPADDTVTFSDGPFTHHFLGVFVPSGATIPKSTRYRWNGDRAASAAADTIRLLDQNTDYTAQADLGVPCTRQ